MTKLPTLPLPCSSIPEIVTRCPSSVKWCLWIKCPRLDKTRKVRYSGTTNMSKKLISLVEWAKKNGISDRHARRLASAGKIPWKAMPIYVMGIPEDYKYKKSI